MFKDTGICSVYTNEFISWLELLKNKFEKESNNSKDNEYIKIKMTEKEYNLFFSVYPHMASFERDVFDIDEECINDEEEGILYIAICNEKIKAKEINKIEKELNTNLKYLQYLLDTSYNCWSLPSIEDIEKIGQKNIKVIFHTYFDKFYIDKKDEKEDSIPVKFRIATNDFNEKTGRLFYDPFTKISERLQRKVNFDSNFKVFFRPTIKGTK